MLCQGEELRPYLENALGAPVPSGSTFIGRFVDGEVKSVAGFGNWTGENCEIFLASTGTLSRELLVRGFKYIFDELGCTRCYCCVKSSLEWHKVLPRFGFVLEGTMRRAFDGDDVLIYGLLIEECKYYGK